MGGGRAPCCDKSKVKRGPWSPAEDYKLISFVNNHGHPNWRSLPKLAGLLRCGKSCRLRWINYLRPDVKRGGFTPEEEETIIKLHGSLGNRWSKIASELPGRTDNEIKNVWNTYLKRRCEERSGKSSKKGNAKDSSASSSSGSNNLANGEQNNSSTTTENQDHNSNNDVQQRNSMMITAALTSSSASSSSSVVEEMETVVNNSDKAETQADQEENGGGGGGDGIIEIPTEFSGEDMNYDDIWKILDDLDNQQQHIYSSNHQQLGAYDDDVCTNWLTTPDADADADADIDQHIYHLLCDFTDFQSSPSLLNFP